MSVGWSVPPVFEERGEVDIKIQRLLAFYFHFSPFSNLKLLLKLLLFSVLYPGVYR